MTEKRIKLIFRGENSANIRDHVDFGPLVAPLTVPLEHAGVGGRLQIGFQRTHEWEAEVVLIWSSVGAVAAGALAQFGARVADVIWDWAKNQLKHVEVDGKKVKSAKQLQESLHFEVRVQAGHEIERIITIIPK